MAAALVHGREITRRSIRPVKGSRAAASVAASCSWWSCPDNPCCCPVFIAEDGRQRAHDSHIAVELNHPKLRVEDAVRRRRFGKLTLRSRAVLGMQA